MAAQSPELKDSAVAKSVDARHAAWEEDLPLGDDASLWDYLSALDQGSRLALLAHCLSFGINALQEGEPLRRGHHFGRSEPAHGAG